MFFCVELSVKEKNQERTLCLEIVSGCLLFFLSWITGRVSYFDYILFRYLDFKLSD